MDSNQGRTPFLSIVIRSGNEALGLRPVFEALAAQECDFAWEVILVNSDSGDETRELCQEFNARLVPIGHNAFNGRASNLGIRESRGELVMILSAHLLPLGSYFLASSVRAFVDPMVAAARCLGSDAEQIRHWYKPRDIQYESQDEQKNDESSIEWPLNYPSTDIWVIRRTVWQQTKYNEDVESCEDRIWALQVLNHGLKIRCFAEAVYVCPRRIQGIEELKRRDKDYKALYQISGYVPLTWPQFLERTFTTILVAPYVAGRYLLETFAWNLGLATVHWQARLVDRGGSIREFDSPNHTPPGGP